MNIHLGNSSLRGKHTTATKENGILRIFDVFTETQEKINNGVHSAHQIWYRWCLQKVICVELYVI